MVNWRALLRQLLTERIELFVAVFLVLVGALFGVAVVRGLRRLLRGLGVPEAVEGTPFERMLERFGTTTTGLISWLSGLFVFGIALVVAIRLTGYLRPDVFASRLTNILPQVFIAMVVLIAGVITGERTALVLSEKLKSVKLPEVNFLPKMVKWSIFYVAGLIALSQLNVATGALLVLLGAYGFGVFFLGGLAGWDLLRSAAAGIYLLLTEPYSIGDEVEVDGKRGIVQEVDTFVTHIESDGEEFIIPNARVFKSGIVRVRD